MTYKPYPQHIRGGVLSRGERPENGRMSFHVLPGQGPDPKRISFVSLGAGGSDRGSVRVAVDLEDAAAVAHALLDAARAIAGIGTARPTDGKARPLINSLVRVGSPTVPIVAAPAFLPSAPPWVPQVFNVPAYAFTIEAAGPPVWDRWRHESIAQSGRLFAHAVASEGRPWRYVFLTSGAPDMPAPHGVEHRASASLEDTALFAHGILDAVNEVSKRCTCRAA